MSEQSTPDISKIIGIIMENPHIIEEISALAAKGGTEAPSAAPPNAEHEEIASPKAVEATAVPTAQKSGKQGNRTRLLSAFKPYLSGERARAIDSMISIAEILEAIRR